MLSTQSFKPAVFKTGESGVLFLPRPVIQCSPEWGWKFDLRKAPYKETASVYGISRDPQPIQISGAFGQEEDDSDKLSTEAAMWDYADRAQAYLDCEPDEDLEFFLYHDVAAGQYRKFKSVYAAKFSINMGDEQFNFWTWSLSLQLTDPAIYNGAPGV